MRLENLRILVNMCMDGYFYDDYDKSMRVVMEAYVELNATETYISNIQQLAKDLFPDD